MSVKVAIENLFFVFFAAHEFATVESRNIYVLDIVMPGTNGIKLGQKLREAGYNGKIIYLTSSEEYPLDAFKVKALNYIIKPITEKVFYEAMVFGDVYKLFRGKKACCELRVTWSEFLFNREG